MNLNSPLFTDFYQLTMAQGYWQLGMAEQTAAFNLFFRKNPFHGQYAVSCGLAEVIDFLAHYQFNRDELDYLSSLKDKQNKPLFKPAFIDYLEHLQFKCNVWGIPEGELVFPHEPLLSVTGPLLQCQLIETALVNHINFATLIATKASRVVLAADPGQVVEFGMRRAQGPDGAVTASRAAYIGGCDSISNVFASMEYGLPMTGTIAHSWVMSFATEQEAFDKAAEVMPHNAVLLVDTYNTIAGVKRAIAVGTALRNQGSDLLAIRLDSGDLNQLSHESRKLLDQAGFIQTKIIASGDLDEYLIEKLKQANAPIDIWGVGTRLTTAYDQPSLDTAYKLAAIMDKQGHWHYKVKRSDTAQKSTHPGIQQVRRFYHQERLVADVIYDRQLGFIDPPPKRSDSHQDVLVEIIKDGQLVYESMPLSHTQALCKKNVKEFVKDTNDQPYPVSLDSQLQNIKDSLLSQISQDIAS